MKNATTNAVSATPMPAPKGLLATHAALVVLLLAGCATANADPLLRGLLAIPVLVVLLPPLRGLWRRQRSTYQWVALVMVLIAGLAITQVVGTLGQDRLSALILLASLFELALLYALNRVTP